MTEFDLALAHAQEAAVQSMRQSGRSFYAPDDITAGADALAHLLVEHDVQQHHTTEQEHHHG